MCRTYGTGPDRWARHTQDENAPTETFLAPPVRRSEHGGRWRTGCRRNVRNVGDLVAAAVRKAPVPVRASGRGSCRPRWDPGNLPGCISHTAAGRADVNDVLVDDAVGGRRARRLHQGVRRRRARVDTRRTRRAMGAIAERHPPVRARVRRRRGRSPIVVADPSTHPTVDVPT